MGPHIRNIFISTETELVIAELVRNYPQYSFYFLDYTRTVQLQLGNSPAKFDYHNEFLFSMANLYVASTAQGFIGTLTSNWCYLIMEFERTRGDGGMDYQSIDLG